MLRESQYMPSSLMRENQFTPSNMMQENQYMPSSVKRENQHMASSVKRDSHYMPSSLMRENQFLPNSVKQENHYMPTSVKRENHYIPSSVKQECLYMPSSMMRENQYTPYSTMQESQFIHNGMKLENPFTPYSLMRESQCLPNSLMRESQYTPEERRQIMQFYEETKSPTSVQRKFRSFYKTSHAPCRKTILDLVRKYQDTGSIHNKARPGRPRTARIKECIERIKGCLAVQPDMSVRRISKELQLSLGSVQRIVKELKSPDKHIDISKPSLFEFDSYDYPKAEDEQREIFDKDRPSHLTSASSPFIEKDVTISQDTRSLLHLLDSQQVNELVEEFLKEMMQPLS